MKSEARQLRILIITHFFWPESFKINAIAAELVRRGHAVTVLTNQPNYPEGRVYDGYRAARIAREDWCGVEILRLPTAARKRGGALALAMNYLSILSGGLLLGPLLLRGRPFDSVLVFATSPLTNLAIALPFKISRKAKLVAWVQDLWPEALRATGFVRNRLMLRAIGTVVNCLYRRFDLLLGQSGPYVRLLQDRAPGTATAYLPNPCADDVLVPAPDGISLGLGRGFHVVFAGNLGAAQGLELVIQAAAILRNHPDICFNLIGDGPCRQRLIQLAKSEGLSNVQFIDRQPASAMPAVFGQSSALLVCLVDDPMLSHTVPSKVQDYLASGRPVIAAVNGEAARLVASIKAGVACSPSDPEGLAKAVLTLYNEPREIREEMGRAGREYADLHFTLDAVVSRLAQHMANP